MPSGGENRLLNNKIIDPLRLQGVSNGLGDEHRQHDGDSISQGIGQLEHDDSQRDRRPLSINERSNSDKNATRG